nr:MAG TPA: hypothetical protein [Caudoviricetes sp.]
MTRGPDPGRIVGVKGKKRERNPDDEDRSPPLDRRAGPPHRRLRSRLVRPVQLGRSPRRTPGRRRQGPAGPLQRRRRQLRVGEDPPQHRPCRLSLKAPAPAGASPSAGAPLRSPRRALRAPQTPPPRPPYRRRPARPSEGRLRALEGAPEGGGRLSWAVRPRRRPRAITQRRCCENPGTQNVSLVSFSRNRD